MINYPLFYLFILFLFTLELLIYFICINEKINKLNILLKIIN